MEIQNQIREFLETTTGVVKDVFFELYQIIAPLEMAEQARAIQYICENYHWISTDGSRKIAETHIPNAVSDEIGDTFRNDHLQGEIRKAASGAAMMRKEPEDFYLELWVFLTKKYTKTSERALLVYELTEAPLIPYRPVGIGISMSDEAYREHLRELSDPVLTDARYIMQVDYPMRTQYTSLLVEQLLALKTKEEQSVYLSMILKYNEELLKSRIRAFLD